MTDTLLFVGDLQNDLTVLAGLRDRPEHLVLLGWFAMHTGRRWPSLLAGAFLVAAGMAMLIGDA